MSSHSYSTTCPNCNGDLDVYESNRPYPSTNTECMECGFGTVTTVMFATLDELNEYRRDKDLNELKELPVRNFIS